jgi:probable HAF family extracellular repeat protein
MINPCLRRTFEVALAAALMSFYGCGSAGVPPTVAVAGANGPSMRNSASSQLETRHTHRVFLTPMYNVQDLGSLVPGGHRTLPNAINDGGTVVGQSCASDCSAFYWNGRLRRIPVPYNGNATDIEDDGTIVGDGFVFMGHRIISLQTPWGDLLSGARINNAGDVVANDVASTNEAYIAHRSSGYRAQPISGIDYSIAYGITDRKDVLLYGSVNRRPLGYTVLKNGAFVPVAPRLTNFIATGIDDSDDVTGFVVLNENTLLCDAVVYHMKSRSVDKLGPLSQAYPSTRALASNDRGAVVGGAGFKGSFNEAEHAFYWDPATGMIDLNAVVPPSRYDLTLATGINNAGQIVAIGILPGEQEGIDGHALLLTPARAQFGAASPGKQVIGPHLEQHFVLRWRQP